MGHGSFVVDWESAGWGLWYPRSPSARDLGHPAEKGQAAWLEKSVTAAIDEGVSWFTYWDTHDVDRKLEFNPLEYSQGPVTNDGRVKEQGRVFKQLADAYQGKAVVYPKAALPEPPRVRTMDGTWKWLLDWVKAGARG